MFNYQTSIDTNKQVFDPSKGQKALAATPPVQFPSAAANQHFQNMYRAQGQKAAMDLGRAASQNQNQYYMAAQRAQDQSVLGGLNLLSDQQANAAQRRAEADNMRFRFANIFLGGKGGLLGGLL
jgi:hypothetical protein